MRRVARLALSSCVLLGLLAAAPAVGQSDTHRRLAFSMDRDIHRIDLDGRNLRNLTQSRRTDGRRRP